MVTRRMGIGSVSPGEHIASMCMPTHGADVAPAHLVLGSVHPGAAEQGEMPPHREACYA